MNESARTTRALGGSHSRGGRARGRREVLAHGLAGALAGAAWFVVRPASATPQALREAVAAFTGGGVPREGRVKLDLAELVENGNAVPVTVSVQSPMTEADHVRRIALFTEHNPEPGVAVFHLSPRNGRAVVSTRMRLATSQQVLVLAQMSDGSFWQTAMDVVVTLAACVEG
jgi:sulfur-oxidizing protein SoxY